LIYSACLVLGVICNESEDFKGDLGLNFDFCALSNSPSSLEWLLFLYYKNIRVCAVLCNESLLWSLLLLFFKEGLKLDISDAFDTLLGLSLVINCRKVLVFYLLMFFIASYFLLNSINLVIWRSLNGNLCNFVSIIIFFSTYSLNFFISLVGEKIIEASLCH